MKLGTPCQLVSLLSFERSRSTFKIISFAQRWQGTYLHHLQWTPSHANDPPPGHTMDTSSGKKIKKKLKRFYKKKTFVSINNKKLPYFYLLLMYGLLTKSLTLTPRQFWLSTHHLFAEKSETTEMTRNHQNTSGCYTVTTKVYTDKELYRRSPKLHFCCWSGQCSCVL